MFVQRCPPPFLAVGMRAATRGFPPLERRTTSFDPMKIQNTHETLQAEHANLARSEFNDVNLQEATFTNVNLSKAAFTDINFTGAKFSNLNLTNVEIEACETAGMKLRGVLVSDLFEAYRRKT